MEALEAIFTRRSIRQYENKKIPDELVQKILAAGMSAPSAGNEQPWQFILLSEKSILQEMHKLNPYAVMAKDASLAIIVCGDLSLEKHEGFWVEDCAAAAQNILLAVHALGLGAVWTGIYPRQDRVEAFRNFFKMPEHVIPLALIPIGYPAQKPVTQERFRQDRIHTNKW